jgi:GR25 family glycosyltransferase involved in LPS biosynthesis
MRCHFINLAARADRRAALEANFQRHGGPGWTLQRFEAVDTRAVGLTNVPGALSPGAKGCFLSHLAVLRESLAHDGPVMVLEDDACFGPSSWRMIDQCLANMAQFDWDILYTDICVGRTQEMFDLVLAREGFDASARPALFDVRRFAYAGSTAYIVNGRSKAKMLKLLEAHPSLDTPYDLRLRELTHGSQLQGLALFPFPTTLSGLAETSGIQAMDEAAVEWVLNTFRRMVWLDRDIGACLPAVERARGRLRGEKFAAFGVLFGAMLSHQAVGA